MGKKFWFSYLYILFISLQTYRCLSETFTVAYFHTNSGCANDVASLLNSSLVGSVITNNYEFMTICDIEESEMIKVFQNYSVDIFIGPVNYPLDQSLIKHARLFERPYISPFSPLPHYDNLQVFSVGSGFEQTAVAVVTIFNHFQWRNILILASLDENWMELGNVIFIYLSSDGFMPAIRYIRKRATDSEMGEILENVKHEQKGILLCTGFNQRTRLLEMAAVLNMHVHHAFFTFVMSPYTLHTEDSTVLQSSDHKHILESIFEIHPDFIQESNELHGWHSPTNASELIEHFILDSLLILDYALNSHQNKSSIDYSHLFDSLRNKTIHMYSGEIIVDMSNEIMYDFVLYDFDIDSWKYVKIQEVIQSKDGIWRLLGIDDVMWPHGIILPPDECFHPDSCEAQAGLDAFYILAIAISVLVVVGVATAIVITVWRNVIKKEMLKGHHKILLTSQDLVFLQRKDVQKGSKMIGSAITDKPDILKAAEKPNRSMASLHEYSDITDTARYNGDLVHVKELKGKGFEMKSKVLNVVKTLREIRHENVNAIIGFFEDQTNHFVISDYCNRGSLEDVIKNTDIKLDWDFKVSLLTDLIRGIRFIHNSAIRYHGNLKWQNCVIDSRWVLKVTDFGLSGVYEASKCTPEYEDKDLLFKAPEHLRTPNPILKGSEKADVYSIAIIMQSVVLRSDPFCTCGLSTKEILHKLRNPPPLLRPSVSQQAAPPQYIQIMKICWSENPDMRPTVEEIYQQYKTITGGKKMNIVDTMFRMLEKYSTDLEDLVRERTMQLEDEKKKTDTLLYRMLPPIVAESLKIGTAVKAETFSEVTIYFSDIVGFTTISALSTPMEVVDLLNDLYTMFDAVIDNFDVYKVETIGDAYMVVSGLPIRNGNRHAGEISTMALELLSHCGSFVIKHMPEVPLRVRIGLHSGSCVAGVVGLTMPRYCLFGDTVNTASRMESTGAPYRIHISEDVKSFLDDLGGYTLEYRGEVELKGKGMARTYWLTGKEGYTKTLPEPPPLTGLSLLEKDCITHTKTSSESKVKQTQAVHTSTGIPNSPNVAGVKGKQTSVTTSLSGGLEAVRHDSGYRTSIDEMSQNGKDTEPKSCDQSAASGITQNKDKTKVSSDRNKSIPAISKDRGPTESSSFSKSSVSGSGASDTSESKASSSAVYVSVLEKSALSSLENSNESSKQTLGDNDRETINNVFVPIGSDTLDENTPLFETKPLIKNGNHANSGTSNFNEKNERYFHEIENYFKEQENGLPVNIPKAHKTKDALKIKRSHNSHEGGAAHTYHNNNSESASVSSLQIDHEPNLTNIESGGQNRNVEFNGKRKAYTKKGNRHKVYDSPVQVAEYRKSDNYVMHGIHSKPKARERALSDIPSSRLCSPEINSDSQDSVNDDAKQTDADKISLNLPTSESLV